MKTEMTTENNDSAFNPKTTLEALSISIQKLMDESSLADQINYKFVTTNHNRIQQKILC
jgi:hypothetical protein